MVGGGRLGVGGGNRVDRKGGGSYGKLGIFFCARGDSDKGGGREGLEGKGRRL